MTNESNKSDDQPEPLYCEHCGPSGAPCPTCGETLP